MSVIITDTGFAADDWAHGFRNADSRPANDCKSAVDLPSDTAPDALAQFANAKMIRIDFPTSADGRGFTLASLLRGVGFQGRLRARVTSLPINTLWPAGPALTRSKSMTISPPASPRPNGLLAQTGNRTTIRRDFAARPFPDPHQRLNGGRPANGSPIDI